MFLIYDTYIYIYIYEFISQKCRQLKTVKTHIIQYIQLGLHTSWNKFQVDTMSYTRNITTWSNISKLTQFDIFIGLHKQSHHSDYNAIVWTQHIMISFILINFCHSTSSDCLLLHELHFSKLLSTIRQAELDDIYVQCNVLFKKVYRQF